MNKHWNVECCFGQFLLSASEGNLAHREIISESGYIKPNLDCNQTFPIVLTPNEIQCVANSNGKVELQSKFGLIQPAVH